MVFMFGRLNKNLDRLNHFLEEKNIEELIYILGSRKEIAKRNFWAGLSRGVGIGIGVTLITAILVMILQKIVTLNLPVIGEFIAEIVEIVDKNV